MYTRSLAVAAPNARSYRRNTVPHRPNASAAHIFLIEYFDDGHYRSLAQRATTSGFVALSTTTATGKMSAGKAQRSALGFGAGDT